MLLLTYKMRKWNLNSFLKTLPNALVFNEVIISKVKGTKCFCEMFMNKQVSRDF